MTNPGDFGLTQIGGYVGPLIRLGMWLNGNGFADYEHAFVYIGNARIVEAMPGGARVANLLEFNPAQIAWYRAPNEYGTRVAAHAVMLVGTPYSFLDYLALAADRVRVPFAARFLRHRVKVSGRMICSQLVDEAYLRAGVHLFDDGRDPGRVTPLDLYGLIVKQLETRV